MQTPRSRRPVKTTVRRLLLFVGVPVVACSVTIFVLYASRPSQPEAQPPATTKSTVTPSATAPKVNLPSRLEITGIGVDTMVAPVGLADNGDMDIKENPSEVAWYQYGPRPGQIGSAVIAGHYGWKAGRASVFTQLHTVKAGDIVTVYDDDGTELSFAVREIRSYDPDADATEVFRSNDGKAHLNLITCEGAWNDTEQTYATRLVVFTDKVTP